MEAAGTIGVRDVKGSAILAFSARVEGVTHDELRVATDSRSLVKVMSARGNAALVPASDAAVFSIGTLPADDESLRARLKPFLPVLDRSGYTATRALDAACDVAGRALADGPMDIGGLSGVLTRSLPALSPMCRGRCGVAHIDQGLFDLVGESAVWCPVDEDGHRTYVRTDQLLGAVAEHRIVARTELVRRYLRCHGPSTARELAEWCGISAADATRSLQESDVTPVRVNGRRTFVLTSDAERLRSVAEPAGVRLLPPNDPYLLGRDRDTLLPDRDAQKRIWKPTPNAGAVLHRGEIVASWRTNKKARHLRVLLEPVGKLSRRTLAEIEPEAGMVATLRGCETAELVPYSD